MLALSGLALALSTTSPGSAHAVGATSAPRPLVVVQDPRISESSGLVVSPTHPAIAWTVNDSGSAATLYGVSLTTGRTVARLRMTGTQARDMEAMTAARDAAGRGLLWVGDVGDNAAVRDSVVLRLVVEPSRLPEASATSTRELAVEPVSLRVRYPDGPRDVETLVWTPDGRLLLVSKQLFSATVYQVPPAAVAAALAGRSTSTAVEAAPLARTTMSLVTDGAALPDGRLVLRGYDGASVYPDPATGGTLEPSQRLALPAQEQGETLAVLDGGAAVLVGSEGERQPLYRVAVAPASVDSPAGGSPTSPGSASSPTPGSASSPTPSSGAAPGRGGRDAAGGGSGPALGAAAVLVAGVALLWLRRRRP